MKITRKNILIHLVLWGELKGNLVASLCSFLSRYYLPCGYNDILISFCLSCQFHCLRSVYIPFYFNYSLILHRIRFFNRLTLGCRFQGSGIGKNKKFRIQNLGWSSIQGYIEIFHCILLQNYCAVY